jgi:hypothetical protein
VNRFREHVRGLAGGSGDLDTPRARPRKQSVGSHLWRATLRGDRKDQQSGRAAIRDQLDRSASVTGTDPLSPCPVPPQNLPRNDYFAATGNLVVAICTGDRVFRDGRAVLTRITMQASLAEAATIPNAAHAAAIPARPIPRRYHPDLEALAPTSVGSRT